MLKIMQSAFCIFLGLPLVSFAQLEVTTKGQTPSKRLSIKKSKVPSYTFKPGQDIPRLEIGTDFA